MFKNDIISVRRVRIAQSILTLGYGLDDWGSVPGRENYGNFSLCHCIQTGSGAHPASYPMGTGALFTGIKRPGLGAEHLPPSSADVKNAWSCTSIAQYVFVAWCLIK
jgi:hypothetical protein